MPTRVEDRQGGNVFTATDIGSILFPVPVETDERQQPVFARTVQAHFWSELGNEQSRQLGTIIIGPNGTPIRFVALVCYSAEPGGWQGVGMNLRSCLRRLYPDSRPVAVAGLRIESLTPDEQRLFKAVITAQLSNFSDRRQRFVIY